MLVGGPARGADWLIDSNLDWGQDLYRLPEVAKQLGVERFRLLYFGHVDPSLYGVQFELPSERPELEAYAVSVNYCKGMPYAALGADGQPQYLRDRVRWLAPLVPTARAGSILIFDLRESSAALSDSAATYYKAGMVRLARGEAEPAVEELRPAIERDPQWAEPHYYLATAYEALDRESDAVAVRNRPFGIRRSIIWPGTWLRAPIHGCGTPRKP